MDSLWKEDEASLCRGDRLALRVYTSQLLGRESSLVLHGGGNTSVKAAAVNIFGESEELLHVKGSGWDLATIQKEGFAPVRMNVLLRMADLEKISDAQMVRVQKSAMTDPSAPNPSVEAILHAIIPFIYVDHTHADAVVALTNTENGEQRVRDIYKGRVLIVPYVMPGFILARTVYQMIKNIRWDQYDGMILLNHGVFTFANEAKESYERMIRIVSQAEDYLRAQGVAAFGQQQEESFRTVSREPHTFFGRIKNIFFRQDRPETFRFAGHGRLLELASLRRAVSKLKGSPVLARPNAGHGHVRFSERQDAAAIVSRGPLTPDHVVRTKRTPLIVGENMDESLDAFAREYEAYFRRHANGGLVCLDLAPRWALWPGHGTVVFGAAEKERRIISDIVDHTVWAIEAAQTFGRWKALPEKDIFEVEYWELEQAKLKYGPAAKLFEGKAALVTGAASGIGRACVQMLYAQGAAVGALDINPDIEKLFEPDDILGLKCDITKPEDVRHALEEIIARFGALDILVSNAGIFPAGESIADVRPETWSRSLDINLSGHQRLLQQCVPYLALGLDPAVIFVASKNVPAPGPGASAYSVAKAGLTQLARIAALEFGSKGIRVNVVHPNQVFDTAIWTPEILNDRARHYGMSVEAYKTDNLLKTELSSSDVARMICAMAGPVFSKTTGAQVPVDGGNERVI